MYQSRPAPQRLPPFRRGRWTKSSTKNAILTISRPAVTASPTYPAHSGKVEMGLYSHSKDESLLRYCIVPFAVQNSAVAPKVANTMPLTRGRLSPSEVMIITTPRTMITPMMMVNPSSTVLSFPLVEVRPFRASSHRRYPTQGSEAQLTKLTISCQKADIYISLLVENVNAFCQDCE